MPERLRSSSRFEHPGAETVSPRLFLDVFAEPALLVHHPDRRIVGVNRALERTFGYDASALVGRTTRILHASEETYELFSRLGDLSDGNRSAVQTRYWMRRRNGEVFASEHHVTPVSVGGSGIYLSLIHVVDDPAWIGVLEGVQKLTARERNILACLLTGMSGKEVARVVDISPRTVEKHRDRILEKFSVASTGQLFARFLPGDHSIVDVVLRQP